MAKILIPVRLRGATEERIRQLVEQSQPLAEATAQGTLRRTSFERSADEVSIVTDWTSEEDIDRFLADHPSAGAVLPGLEADDSLETDDPVVLIEGQPRASDS